MKPLPSSVSYLYCYSNHFDSVTSIKLWARLEMKSIFGINICWHTKIWCVSLTMHGASKLIRNYLYTVIDVCLEDKSLEKYVYTDLYAYILYLHL